MQVIDLAIFRNASMHMNKIMAKEIAISPSEGRRLAIISQGLHTAMPFGRGIRGMINAVNHLGYIQIDTISVVERAHHHVLYSRIPQYKKSLLRQAQIKHRKVLEYWSHAAAFIPMDDYRYTIPIQQIFRTGADGWPQCDRTLMNEVLLRVRDEGPLMSRDFEHSGQKQGNWWDWKPAKRALQRLFFEGELLVSHREGFQRVYDLPERIIPAYVDTTSPTRSEYCDYLIDRYIKAHGYGTVKMIGYLRKGMSKFIQLRIEERLREGSLIKINIKHKSHPLIVAHPEVLDLLNRSIKQNPRILSPFDNLVIQRERLKLIFDFDYQIECYVPSEKRVYGYFVLPILIGSRLAGRIDAKADRRSRDFKILSTFSENWIAKDVFMAKTLPTLERYAEFCGCERVISNTGEPLN